MQGIGPQVEATEGTEQSLMSPYEAKEEDMDVREAFNTLLWELRRALKDAQAAGERAFREGRFSDAQAEGKRGEEIARRIEQLEALRSNWDRLVRGAGPSRSKPKRLARGEKTPEKEFWVPILTTLEEMGGRGQMREVLDRLESMLEGKLREVDRELLPSGRSIRWHNTAQWARLRMVKAGLLASDSPHGVWEITEKGREWLRRNRQDA